MLSATGIMAFDNENHPETRGPIGCYHLSPYRIHVTFNDHRLVANAGLLLPVTLAHRLALGPLADHYVSLGDAPDRANADDKMLTLVASAPAVGDCTDNADALGDLPPEFPLGPRAPTGSGEPGFVRPSMVCWGRTRR